MYTCQEPSPSSLQITIQSGNKEEVQITNGISLEREKETEIERKRERGEKRKRER